MGNSEELWILYKCVASSAKREKPPGWQFLHRLDKRANDNLELWRSSEINLVKHLLHSYPDCIPRYHFLKLFDRFPCTQIALMDLLEFSDKLKHQWESQELTYDEEIEMCDHVCPLEDEGFQEN